MFSRTFTVLAALAFVSIASLPADIAWVVREDGVGPAKVGMTLTQLSTALGEKFSMPTDEDGQGCFYVHPAKRPHISFMLLDRRLSRVDVDAPGIFTTEGIQVGDPEAKALRIYGPRLKVEPHHYIDDGHYLTVRSRDGRFGVRFETEKGKITSFYGGLFESIQLVEGCL
jgi:hypothetical protein